MNKPLIEIEVVSDVVCPWCYIGKRRLEKAMAATADRYDFKVWFSPFELNPDVPQEGLDHKAYLAAKFGSEERYEEITAYVSGIAREEGLAFDFSKQKKSPNTRLAHRLLWVARTSGQQARLKEAFMSAFFEKGIDLTSTEEISRIAVDAGMDKKVIEEMLTSDKALQEVVASEAMHHQRGISGVPFYIINNKYGISGAQKPEYFAGAFEQVVNTTASPR